MINNVIGCPSDEVKIGIKLSAEFEQQSPEIWLAKFKHAGYLFSPRVISLLTSSRLNAKLRRRSLGDRSEAKS